MSINSIIDKKIEKLNIGQYNRHIFLCTSSKCSQNNQGNQTWNYLKDRLKELGLSENSVFRSKVGCLRICNEGPIALVYPEGTWYAKVDEERCEEIIQSHLLKGEPLKEYAIAHNPLFMSPKGES